MLPETVLFKISRKWFTPKWIVAYLVLGFAGIFLMCAILKRANNASAFRSCVADLHSQIKLPNGWRIQSCEPGDWSMDFEATVVVPNEKDSAPIIDEFSRLNPWPVALDDSSLTIEPVRENVYLIRMVSPQ